MPQALRALVVEDQPDDRELIVRELRRAGFAADCAFVADAETFSTALAASPWDVILADYHVPGFGGREALAILKATRLDIPFIIVTGTIGDETAAALMRMGASDCVDKTNGSRIGPVIARELTEWANRQARRHAEDLVRQFAAVVESATDAIMSTSLDGTITSWNPAAERIFGWRQDEVCGRHLSFFVPPGQMADYANVVGWLQRGEHIPEFAAQRMHRDGSPIAVVTSFWPVTARDGQVVGVTTIARDVTRLKEAQEAARDDLSRAEATRDDALYQLRLQVSRMPMGYILYDAAFRIIDWNRASEQMFGFTKAEAMAMRAPFEELVPASTRLTLAELFRRVSHGAMNAHSINENLTKSGSRILCEWWNTPLIDATGRFVGMMALAQDVTARESADQRLRIQTEQLRALSASLTTAREKEGMRIARELHDELGSTLTAIKWELEHLAATVGARHDRDDGDILRTKIGSLATDAQTAIKAVQRIATELRPSILDDLGLLHAIQWQAREFEKRTGIPCECDYAEDDLVFSTDQATAVFRIVQEALTNVLRHARATQVQVVMAMESGTFVVRVCDNGVGITPERQAAASALGLLGMHERAALVGASVAITGTAGTGTTVTVRLPIDADTASP